jgi:hypothetical protein
MADLATLLDAALRAAGIPIRGLKIGASADRRTWVVDYAPEATPQQIAAGNAIVAGFDPNDPTVKDATQGAAARMFATQQFAKAAARYEHYKRLGEDAVYDDKQAAADIALWERCFKEAAQA